MVTQLQSLFIDWLTKRVDAKSGRMSEPGCEGDGMAEGEGGAVGMTACGAVQCKENKHLESNECACRADKKTESPCATPKKMEQSLLSNFFGFGRGNDAKTPESAGKKNPLPTPSPPEQKKKKREDKKKKTGNEKTKNGLTTTILSFFTTRITTGDGSTESPHVSRDYRIGDCIEFKSRQPLTPRSFIAKRSKDFAQLSDDSESEDERMRYNIRRAKNLRIADIKEIPVENVQKKGANKIQSDDEIPSTSTRNEAAATGFICDKLDRSKIDTTTVSKTDAQVIDIDICDEVSVLSANDSNIDTSRDPSRSPSPEVPDGEYEVEEIWDFVKNSKSNGLYYVKWKGYGEDENTWEPIENLSHCEDLLYAFYCMRKDEIERGDGFVVEGRGKRKLDMAPDPRPFVRKVREFLNSGSEQQVSEDETEWAFQLIDSGKNFVWSEQKTEKYMQDATQGKLDEAKASELRQQLVYRHIDGKLSDQKKQLKAWAKQLNSVTKGRPVIEVENKLDFSLPPVDFEYINDYVATDGIIIPDDPPFGCDCDGGCAIGKETCCPVLHGTKFAYRNNKRMLAAYNSYLLYECNKKCKCGPECNNRVVQDGVNPLKGLKLCIFRTKNCGWGVKTLKPIRKGTFVCMYVGEILTTTEAERRGEKYDQEGITYLFDLDFNSTDCPYTVDARYKGNVSHFINHSCDPNLAVFGVWVDCLDVNLPKLALFAERDIEKDEELTFDYKRGSGNVKTNEASDAGLTRENGPLIKRQPCMCLSENCRKFLFT